ncbi:MAG TPA: RNA polymerase sigma factor, partial [Gemmataceae bacterium]|nr:RNA polymerase sigma factor [Gemmataceae bacterium]
MAVTPANSILAFIRSLATTEANRHAPDRELLRRFVVEHDQLAFATLVQRHGPMILSLCRRLLGNWHDAEDVFQATFLVLARKSGVRVWHDSIGNWLYLVAYRLARRAQDGAVRRSALESRAVAREQADPDAEITWRELQGVLDEELTRLPLKYREPIVHCCLEGATRDEAARQLGWPLGTLKKRLERGREMLRSRLARRGITLSAALLTPL